MLVILLVMACIIMLVLQQFSNIQYGSSVHLIDLICLLRILMVCLFVKVVSVGGSSSDLGSAYLFSWYLSCKFSSGVLCCVLIYLCTR